MKTFTFLLLILPLLQTSGAPVSSGVVRRSDANYDYGDWRSQAPQKGFDRMAAPVGGMTAFIARLDYPESLRRLKVRGVMRVFVSLDEKGRVLEVRVLKSIHPLLDRIAINAVQRTRWTPALKKNKPAAVKFAFLLTFLPP